jgi:RHS repeat-associated protein
MSRNYFIHVSAIANRIQIQKSLNLLMLLALLLSSCGPMPTTGSEDLITGAEESPTMPDETSDNDRPEFPRPEPVTGVRPEDGSQGTAQQVAQQATPAPQQATPEPQQSTAEPYDNGYATTPMPSPLFQQNQFLLQSQGPEPIAPDSDCTDGECVFWVSASADDAGPDPYCPSYSTNRNEIYFGQCNNGQYIISGFRFPNVTFPQGEKITEAYIEFTVDGPYTTEEITQSIYGEATGNAGSFTSISRPDNRPLTLASTGWLIPSTDEWSLGELRNSPDLTSIIQEIVDRSDWTSGNAIAVIMKTTAPAGGPKHHRRVIGYDRPSMGPENAARLVIKGGPAAEDDSVMNLCTIPNTDECFNSSAAQAQGHGGDPINTRTGGLSYETEDISVPTSAGQLGFQRTYSSLATDLYSDILGYGWTSSLDTRLFLPDDPAGKEGFVLFKAHSANRYEFVDNGDDTYTPAPGVTGSLVYDNLEYTLTLPDQSVYTFDDDGILQTRADPEGRIWEYIYTSGLLTQVSADGGDRYLSLTYDGQGRIETVSDQAERSVTFDYDEAGDLVSATDVSEGEWQYEYDEEHHLTEVINPLEQTVERTEYDLQGRAVHQWDGLDNQTVDITYNLDRTTTIADALDNTITHTYDARNTLIGDTDAGEATVSKKYNNNFRPLQITDPLGRNTNLTWSADGVNLTQIVDAQGDQTDISYNELNQPISVVDPMEYLTSYEYDGTHLISTTDALENETTYTYTTEGFLESATDPLGHTTSYTYDDYGQRISMTDPSNKTWEYAYDELGRLTDTTDPLDRVTHNEYDNAGRPVSVTINYDITRDQNEDNQYNIVTEYQYDLAGNQIAVTDTFGVITRTYYDDTGRPETVVQNLADQSIETSSPPERGSGEIDENLRTDTYYDAAGNVIATRDPNNVITRNYYDQSNRPVTVIQNLFGQDISEVEAPEYDPEYPDQNVRSDMAYDNSGNLIATSESDGVITRTYFDELNRPVTVVRNLTGQSIETTTPPTCGTGLSLTNICTTTTYDKNGNIIATTDPLGIITRTYFDALNRPITVVQNLTGQAVSIEAPPEGEFEDENVRTDTYYDDAGQAIATVDPMGIVTRTYFDNSGRPEMVVRNLVGQDISIETPPTCSTGVTDENICTTSTYDDLGRRIATSDPLGHVVKYDYNDGGQLERVTVNFLDGQIQNYLTQYNIVTEYAYDAMGHLLTTTDTIGRVTTTTYDDLGRTASSTQNVAEGQAQNYQDQFNITTAFTYDSAGAQIAVTDPLGMISRTYYDPLGRAVSMVRNLDGQAIEIGTIPERGEGETNLRVDTVYSGNGQVSASVDELEKTTGDAYDPLGRQTDVSDPLNHVTHSDYDVAGRLINTNDAEGVVTHYGYNALGLLTDVWENYKFGISPNADTNVHTAYTYDANGNRLTIVDGNGNVTTFTYDSLGQLLTEADPLEHTWTYSYDVAGNRVELIDANEATTSYSYDELNRLVLIDYPSTDHDVVFTYDAAGHRLSMTDGLGTTSWTYDDLDRPLTTTDPFDNTVSYAYDALGNRTNLTYPDTKQASYGYDTAQRLQGVALDSSEITGYTYDAAGRVTGMTRANGVTTTYTYDDAGRLTSLQNSAGANALASYTYVYDDVGNRTSVEETYQQPDIVFNDDFESGDLSAWSSSDTGDGNLIATTGAALEGDYGMQATADNQTQVYVQEENSVGEPSYHASFYFDPDSIYIPGGEYFDMLSAQDATLGAAFYVQLRVMDDVYQVAAVAINDNQQETWTPWFTITNSPHAIEMAWEASSGLGADDGIFTLSIDGEEADQVTGIDSDTLLIDAVRLGVLSPSSAAISGSIYFDAFQSSRVSDIGLDSDIPVPHPSDQVLSDAFESGDFSAWSSAATDEGDLSVTNISALEGEYWMQAVVDDNHELYLLDQSPYRETNYHARFYFVPNAVDIPEGDYFDLFVGRDRNAEVAFSVRLTELNSEYYISALAGNDAQQDIETEQIPISNQAHAIELAWVTASSGGVGNGYLTLYVDGDKKSQLAGLENGERRIDDVRLGVLAPSSIDIDGTIYFDDFVSNRKGYIDLNSTIQIPGSLPEQIFADDFESGNLSSWSYVVTDNGDLSVTTNAAIEGEDGLQAVIEDGNDLYVLDGNPFDESHYRARFYFDPNSVTIPNSQEFDIFNAKDINGGTAIQVRLRGVYGEYQVKFVTRDDNAQTYATDWMPITDEPHAIEVEWQTASNSESGNGYYALWLDGVERARVENLSNYTKRIDSARMGVMSLSTSSIAGTIFFDDFTSDRAGYYIGLNPNIPVPEPLPTEVFSDGFESGDLSAWSGASTGGGDLSVSSAAAIEGDFGLQAGVGDQAELYVHDEQPMRDLVYHARFYFDPNSVEIPDGATFEFFRGVNADNGTVFSMQLGMVNDDYAIRAVMVADDQQPAVSDWIPVIDTPHVIELEWWKACCAEVSDGRLFLWIDQNWSMALQGIDNDTKFIDAVEMGGFSPTSSGISGTVYLDDFVSTRIGESYIGPDPNVTLPSTDQIFADGFESGDLSAWDSAETNGGNLSVTANVAIEVDNGLQAVIDDANDLYVIDRSPIRESAYQTRFYFDPNSVEIPAGATFEFFRGLDNNSGTVFYLQVGMINYDYAIRTIMVADDQGTTASDWIPVSDMPHVIELEWWQAWSADVSDGFIRLWIDENETDLEGINNDTKVIDAVEMGAFSITGSGISGTIYLDDFVSTRMGGWYIGPDPNVTLTSPEQIFADAFESGDLSAWDSAETNGGDLSVTANAAIEGDNGLQAVVDGNNDLFVLDRSPYRNPVYHTRFYLDPNLVEIPDEATLDIFRGYGTNSGTAFYLQLGMVNDDYAIRAVMLADDQQTTESDWVPVSDASHVIELEWWQAWSAEVNDGRIRLWIDENETDLGAIDNDTKVIDAVELGGFSPSDSGISGTIYLDDFASTRLGDSYIGPDPNVTLPSPDQIFTDGFESGDLSAWDSSETNSGNLSVTTSASLFDTYGLQAAVDDDSPMFVQDNSPLSEPRYRARYYFDPNGLYIPDDMSLVLLEGRDLTAGAVFQVNLRYSDDEYQVGASLVDDSQGGYATDWSTITDEPHAIEIEWAAAWDAETPNGFINLWLDGEEAGSATAIDNDTLRIDNVRLGVLSLSSAYIAGTLYIDDFVSHQNEAIGLNGQEQRSAQENNLGKSEGGFHIPLTIPTRTPTPLLPSRTPTPEISPTATPVRTLTPTPEPSPTPTLAISRTATPIQTRSMSLSADEPVISRLPELDRDSLGSPIPMMLTAPTHMVSRTIDYTYDSLYRLTAADYSDGSYYHYTYDAVGNRLTQESLVDGLPISLAYTYDIANRLTAVNEVEYTWDNNGNLLDDGVNTYAYDSANRLVSVSGGASEVEYMYNGLGDRLQQTVGSTTTTYVMDLNAGLSEVLNDGTNTYTYGLERISQVGTEDTEYFLGDALGSVRQLADDTGAVTLAKDYGPFGDVVNSLGTTSTSYGFTNEYTSQGLVYLRARYYSPYLNQFIQPDTIVPDLRIPADLNKYSYVANNPVNYTDPTGNSKCVFTTNTDCRTKGQILLEYAKVIKIGVTSGAFLPVEGFAKFADFATWLFNDDWGDIMWSMTGVLNGIDTNKHVFIWYAVPFSIPDSPFFIGQDWLPYKNDPNKNIGDHVYSERGDWNINYWDDTANQAYHFWYYAAVTYYDGAGWARLANNQHDPYWNGETQWDISEEDYSLALKGIELGQRIESIVDYSLWGVCIGNFPAPTLDLGIWIRNNLK